jgi:hypothetical protein
MNTVRLGGPPPRPAPALDWHVHTFLRSSLVWLGVGVVLGYLMVASPAHLGLRTVHAHANLLGFVSMMIFGVAYHVLPRFTGRPLFSVRLAVAHVFVANGGLLLLAGGFTARLYLPAVATPALHLGGMLSGLGAAFFIVNIWRTLGPAGRPAGLAPTGRTG